jgi:putative CocE/NonD family hydrolase
VLIAPGNHCQHDSGDTAFGDIPVRQGTQPWFNTYLAWFDGWLRGQGTGGPALPAYRYYMLGEDQWLDAAQWPPEDTQEQRWYLHSGGHANSRLGDGTLSPHRAAADAVDTYRHDPANPVPTRGGPVCCTGNPADRSGPVDQTDVEQRNDVLVYTSGPLPEPLRMAGPLSAHLVVQTDAEDTDFIARLVDVAPDGRTLGLQEGAFRLRYRNGFDQPRAARAGERYQITVPMRSFAYRVPAGHRIRLQVTSSNFPRLERHLGGAGRNLETDQFVVAQNRVHHGPAAGSYLSLPVLPNAPASAAASTPR